MGLLDDAIREHLDLKRRRGADPVEIERAEREALGPVRRDPFEPAPGEIEDEAALPAYEPDEGVFDDEYYEDEEWEEGFEDEEPPPPVNESRRARDVYDPTRNLRPRDEFDDGPSGPRRRGALSGDETVEYDLEEELGREAHRPDEPGREDVLEETPEFLQDAPDHDELWFEQRPPRDFDFDG